MHRLVVDGRQHHDVVRLESHAGNAGVVGSGASVRIYDHFPVTSFKCNPVVGGADRVDAVVVTDRKAVGIQGLNQIGGQGCGAPHGLAVVIAHGGGADDPFFGVVGSLDDHHIRLKFESCDGGDVRAVAGV